MPTPARSGPASPSCSTCRSSAASRRSRSTSASVSATCEQDDRLIEARTTLPAVLSCAERLCEPSKVAPEGRAAVDADRARARDGSRPRRGPVGAARAARRPSASCGCYDDSRRAVRLEGPVEPAGARGGARCSMTPGCSGGSDAHEAHHAGPVADGWIRDGASPAIGVLIEPGRPRVAWELLGAAAELASQHRRPGRRHRTRGRRDRARRRRARPPRRRRTRACCRAQPSNPMLPPGSPTGARRPRPWAVLAAGTMWGREVAARAAGRLRRRAGRRRRRADHRRRPAGRVEAGVRRQGRRRDHLELAATSW